MLDNSRGAQRLCSGSLLAVHGQDAGGLGKSHRIETSISDRTVTLRGLA